MRRVFVRFFTIADYEEEEIWLREQHQKGWRLDTMIPPCFYLFESCEPEDVIYRLDHKNAKRGREYLQMLQDFGWEFIVECLGWLYFRKPAAEAETAEDGELFSDNASRAELATHVARTRLIPLCILFLGCVVPNFVRAVSGNSLGTFLSVVFGILFVIYVFLIVYCGTKLRRIRARYRFGG